MAYQSSEFKLSGSSYIDVERKARKIHNQIARRTKRNAYVRSVFFKKEKIFISLFWEHLNQKSQTDRRRRLQLYNCAIDLLLHTREEPTIRFNPNGNQDLVFRFSGISKEGVPFFVQVKEDRRTKRKYFMSVFPFQNRKTSQV